MNDFDYPGSAPCADYEFEIAELLDGELPPERARIVSLHLANCVRCRAWRDRYAAVDSGLALSLTAPALSADFASRLQKRLAEETRVRNGVRRDEIEREYSRELDFLKRGWKVPAALNGIAAAALTVCVYAATRGLAAQMPLDAVAVTPSHYLTIYSMLGAVAVTSALVWSFGRGAWVRFLPRR